MTPKQVKRLQRLIRSVDAVAQQMDHRELRELVRSFNGSRNLRECLGDFSSWYEGKVETALRQITRSEAAKD